MIPVVTRAQMRAFEKHAIDVCHVPSLLLMENAGRGATDVLERELLGGVARGKRVVVVCGAGNNGGDGFVVARQLLARGAHVETWLAGDAQKLTADCRANRDAFAGLGGRLRAVGALEGLRAALAEAAVVVDALFGTGLDRPIDGVLAEVIALVNAAPAATLALDVPSGMDADTGAAMGAAVRADLTVTFAHRKLGHLTGQGAALSGTVHVVDIGVPSSHEDDAQHVVMLSEASDLRRLLGPRAVDAHKYKAGHVAILGGSAGKIGAPMLAAHGVLRAGAGAASVVTWAEAAAALQSRVLEVMATSITDDQPIGAQLDERLAHKRAVIVGPGFGLDARAKAAVAHVLATFAGPIVADADALTMHGGELGAFAPAAGHAILTPHAGELARLLGTTSDEIEADRFAAVRAAATRAGVVVVLKGPYTIIAAPDGRVVVNPTGNPVLATAGSGDVLSGITGALACSLPPFEAAWCAAYLHGASGDAWRAANGDRGMLASEIADGVPAVLRALRASG
ncbi:MAG: epimerase / dehydratase [Labilithrix sp.]|nr:epimerase / dehydratase [Labilithrix sp.]